MTYSEEAIWQIIDGDISPSQYAMFSKACSEDPLLQRRLNIILKTHNLMKALASKDFLKSEKLSPPGDAVKDRQKNQRH